MRSLSISLLLALAAFAPAAAQGIAVPIRCAGDCAGQLPATLAVDSVQAWANVDRGEAMTSTSHVFRNGTAGTLDAAFFFPLPRDAAIHTVSVTVNGKLTQYNQWSRPQESRWILDGLARDRPDAALAGYARTDIVHVPVLALPPGAAVRLQIVYGETLRGEGGSLAYRYPLSTAAVSPVGSLRMGMTIRTEAGFRDISSPSHAVDVRLGSEPGPCLPRERCGTRGFPSERVRVVRIMEGGEDRARDFEVVYTPAEADARRVEAGAP